ncbi:MAG: class C sortase [Bariatricus sp.]
MKRKVSLVAFVFFYLSCIAIMDYPYLARIYNGRVQGKAVTEYEESIEKMDRNMWQEELDKAERYNRFLGSGTKENLEDPFGKISQNHREYEELLNVGKEGIMGWIEIPQIQVALPIYHGTSENVLQKGAGHLEGSSLPVGGTDTHTVISAHRGLPSKKMFTDLDQLETGDIFYIHVFQKILAYQIVEIETVRPDETAPLAIRKGEDLATLVTCTPYGMNTHRMYVHGKRIPFEKITGESAGKIRMERRIREYWWLCLTIVLIVWLVILMIRFCRNKEGAVRKRKRRRKRKCGKQNQSGRK